MTIITRSLTRGIEGVTTIVTTTVTMAVTGSTTRGITGAIGRPALWHPEALDA